MSTFQKATMIAIASLASVMAVELEIDREHAKEFTDLLEEEGIAAVPTDEQRGADAPTVRLRLAGEDAKDPETQLASASLEESVEVLKALTATARASGPIEINYVPQPFPEISRAVMEKSEGHGHVVIVGSGTIRVFDDRYKAPRKTKKSATEKAFEAAVAKAGGAPFRGSKWSSLLPKEAGFMTEFFKACREVAAEDSSSIHTIPNTVQIKLERDGDDVVAVIATVPQRAMQSDGGKIKAAVAALAEKCQATPIIKSA